MSLHSCYRTGRLPNEKPMYGVLLNPDHPLSQGLVGCWLFNEGGGNEVYDLSGNRNHGDFGGGTLSYAPSWVAGRTGPALDFDGTDDYVDCGNDESLNITDAITIEAWIYVTTLAPAYQYIVDKWTYTPGNYRAWSLNFGTGSGSSYLAWRASVDGTDSGEKSVSYNYVGKDNQWGHIVGTYDGSNLFLYVNGNQVATGDGPTSIISTNQNLYIGGGDQGTAYPFNGTIDEVRIYNRALSAAEIWQLYDEQYPMFYHPMEAELLYAVPAAYARSYGYIIGF